MTTHRSGRTGGAVIALLLAIGVTGCAGDAPGEQDEPAAASPSAGAGTDEPGTDPGAEGLPRGEAPAVDVVRGTVLHRPDGTRLDLELEPEWGVTAVARHGDDLFVTDGRWFEETVGMHRLTAEGRRLGSWSSTGPAVTSPAGDVAWVDFVASEAGGGERSRIHFIGADGARRSQRLEGQHVPKLLGLVDGEVVYTARVRASGNRWATRQFSTDLTTAPRRVEALPVRVLSPDGDNWYENSGNPEDALVAISLGGHVDSMGAATVMRDVPPVWESNQTLLLSRLDGERTALARISSDAQVERVGEWRDATAQNWDVPVR